MKNDYHSHFTLNELETICWNATNKWEEHGFLAPGVSCVGGGKKLLTKIVTAARKIAAGLPMGAYACTTL